MFERMTDRARRVLVLAQEEARGLGHAAVGPEHILLALIRERGGVAGQTLESCGVTLSEARAQVEDLLGRGIAAPSAASLPWTAESKKLLELALRETLLAATPRIGTEQLVVALLREEDEVALEVLFSL